MDRTTRSATLTVPGREFLASAQRILDDLDQALRNVDQLVAKQRGHVVIACPVVLATTLLPSVIAGFRGRYPAIELTLSDSLPNEVLPQVRTGAADVGIGTFSKFEQQDLEHRLLFKEPMVAVLRKSHALARANRLTWSALEHESILAMRRGSVFRDLADEGFAASRLTLQPVFEANFVGSIVGLAEAGLGIAIVPGYAAALTNRSRMACQRLENPVIEREVLIVRRAGVSPSPAAAAFIEFLFQFHLETYGVERRQPKRNRV